MNPQDAAFWERQYERQKLARKEAEFLLESKSKEIYAAQKKLQMLNQNLEKHISIRTERLERLSQILLSMSMDPVANRQLLTDAARELLFADYAVYSRLESGKLHAIATSNTPATSFESETPVEGRLAWKVIQGEPRKPVVLDHLQPSRFPQKDADEATLQLTTCFAHPVSLDEKNVGAICCYYRGEISPSQDDRVMLGLIASAISKEEKRYQTIQEKQQVELSLEAKEAEAEQFFTLAPELLFIADGEGNFHRLNPAWKHVLGYAEKELETGNFLERVHPQDLESTQNSIRKLLDTHEVQSFSNRYRCQDGSYRWIEWRTSFPANRFIYAVARDISQQEELKHTLIKAKESAEQAANAKSLFLANMSHEIRTPLNGIISMNRLMLESELPSDLLKYADAVQSSATSLMGILNDILDISKVEAGELELEHYPFSLFEVIEGVVDLTQIRAENAGLQYVVCYDPELPDRLIADPSRIRQILLNIISNAIKFTAQGSITIHVNYQANTPEAGWLQFEIVDTGPGISKTVQQHLFEPFKQGDSSINRKYGGTGLGLSICRALVEKMKGSITVHSDEGRGSTFSFRIPVGVELNHDRTATQKPLGKHCGPCIITSPDPLRLKALSNLLILSGTTPMSIPSFQESLQQLRMISANVPITWILDTKTFEPADYLELEKITRERPRTLTLLLISDASSKVERGSFRFYEYESIVFPNRKSDFINRLCRLCQIPCSSSPKELQRTQNLKLMSHKGVRVLLAEDNKINQLACRTTMQNMGFEVEIAENGYEVLRKLESANYDMILMDINMPEMDGIEATRAIRSSGSNIPIVALTANAMKGDREKFIECGMNDYLSKPLMIPSFVSVINRILGEGTTAGDPVIHSESESEKSTSSSPVVQWENLKAKLGGDMDLIYLLLAKFDEELKKNADRAFRAIDSGEIQQAISSFHLLSGSAATLEISGVQSRAKDLEQYLKRDALDTQLNALIEKFQESVKQWKQWYAEHKTTHT